jgi:antagonist of KipI
MSFLVLDPGLESRIVDLGRPGSRSLGVPVGGAADRRSLILGNSLIGNPPDAAALEITLKGPRLRADADVGCVVAGAPFELHCDGARLQIGRSFTLRAGEELHISGTSRGARAYLCVRGGFDSPVILSSRSALQPLRKHDVLRCESSSIGKRRNDEMAGDYPDVVTVSVVPGLQESWFSEREFYEQTFTVTPASNRMGLRLQGKPLSMPEREMVSEPVCPGSIQVTRDGQCIILGIDGQTIGGYPKIAQVIQADLNELGQMRPSASIRFAVITVEEALRRDREQEAELQISALRLRLAFECS